MTVLLVTQFPVKIQGVMGCILASYLQTNKFDKQITGIICETVFGVCVVLGVTVILCFAMVYCYRYFSRRMEIKKKENDEKEKEIDRLKKALDGLNDEQKDLKAVNDLIDKINSMSLTGHEVNITHKQGNNSISIKYPVTANNCRPASQTPKLK